MITSGLRRHRQGFHVTPAGLRIVLAALRFYLAALSWLAKPTTDPHDAGSRKRPERYTELPDTIGDMRRQGVIAVTITCAGANCWNAKRVLFDDLALDDATPVPDVPKSRSFRCQRCGSMEARVSPDWTDHKAQGNGRTSS